MQAHNIYRRTDTKFALTHNYREKCVVNFVVLRGLCDPALTMNE